MVMERKRRNRTDWFAVEIERYPSWELLGGCSMDCPPGERFASFAS